MHRLDAAKAMRYLRSGLGNHLEALHGPLAGRHPSRVDDMWGLVFPLEDDNDHEVRPTPFCRRNAGSAAGATGRSSTGPPVREALAERSRAVPRVAVPAARNPARYQLVAQSQKPCLPRANRGD